MLFHSAQQLLTRYVWLPYTVPLSTRQIGCELEPLPMLPVNKAAERTDDNGVDNV